MNISIWLCQVLKLEIGDQYDIVAEDRNGNKFFFEVKSTMNGRSDDHFPFQISVPQMNFMDANSNHSLCFIAIVLNAWSPNPEAAFFPFIPERNLA